ncbi:MAG: NAD-dependent epimerase/dehydratase family protein [Caldilineaceae bacterium]|nr:NAD-dependent epimerase/dehydratase family protein [Caldilineaceae bacterium]
MNQKIDLRNATILVTGASGFIGKRLTEYLTLHYGANVRAMVRSYGPAVHLARLPVEIIAGDLMDPISLQRAISGCDLVFHCAAGISGSDESRRSVTVDGTRHLLEVARQAQVSRFVHISTVAVHGPNPGPIIDERLPLVHSNDIYADAKADAEQWVFRYGKETGLPVTVLRPTVVYGPRSGAWTVGPISGMQRGAFKLIGGGVGSAHHVYVDDVVQALLLAATRPEAVGEAFIISSNSSVPWHEFFGYYAQLLGIELPNLSLEEIALQRQRLKQLRNPVEMALTFAASPRARVLAHQIPGVGASVDLLTKAIPQSTRTTLLAHAASVREAKLNPPKPPKPWIVDYFCAQNRCRIEKAQRMLGYQPQFSLEEGQKLTTEWLRAERII